MASSPVGEISAGIGGAVSDLFAGFGTLRRSRMQAEGQRITAGGTRITAQGTRITAEGTRIGAEGTRLNAEGLRIKARGGIAEAENYDLAAELARKNEAYSMASTRIQRYQNDRQVAQALGQQRAGVAAAGFSDSGSAMDLMRDSASQGALASGVLGMQGAITAEGYEEQAKSFETMSRAGRATAAAEFGIADRTDALADRSDLIATRQDAIAASQDAIANRQDALAGDIEDAGRLEATGQFVSSAIRGVTAIAQIAAML